MSSRPTTAPTPTPRPADLAADRALKAKHRAVWASGDYPSVATNLISDLGPVLVAAVGVQPGDRLLDVAAGSGNVAVPAAGAGARVIASDLTPELFDAGRRLATRAGVDVEWQEADAEALPFADHTFDTVTSCVGVMFAPHHQAAADELVRVCRPGGTIGVLSWTPGGFIGQLFAAMKPFNPAPPPGAQPPPLWGEEAHVRSLLGERVRDVTVERRTLPVDYFATSEEFRDFFRDRYGPTISTYHANADSPERLAALDTTLVDLAASHLENGVMGWEYLLLTARKV